MTFSSVSEHETEEIAKKIAELITPGSKIRLTGVMGAGKSFLSRNIIQSLGYDGLVPSPTFTLINKYSVQLKQTEIEFYHADLYRLSSEEELIEIGMDEIMSDNSILFVEWAERFPDYFKSCQEILIEIVGEEERLIHFSVD